MKKIDCEINTYVANVIKEQYPWIINATADCNENFGIDDIMFSAGTEDNYIGVAMEVKSILGGWQLKYDGDWNPYFTTAIYNKLAFKGTVPEAGTPVYFINATDAYGNYEKGKYSKILREKACLAYAAPDGILIFTPKTLEEAFVGYADYYVAHRTMYGKNHNRLWETKAVFDLNKGVYIPCNPPIELFER